MMIRLFIALLLLAAVPVMAAEDQTPAAPPLAQQQVRDALLEQLQTQARESQTRADEAERRERDAEIQRLADQARQAQARAGEEEQLKLAAQHELMIQEAKAELQNNAYSRLEILIGLFGVLITMIVLFITLRLEKVAVAEAVKGVGDEIKTRLTEVDTLVEKIRDHETQASRIVAALSPGEVPKSVEDRKTIADVAREAGTKPPRDRTAKEFRAIIIDLLTQKKWAEMLTVSQQMRLLHEDDDDSAFAHFNEAFALGKLERWEEAIAEYEALIAKYGEDKQPKMWERIRKAHYNVACAYARKGSVIEAITALRTMRRANYPLDHKQITDDSAFDAIRDDPDFKKFLDDDKGQQTD